MNAADYTENEKITLSDVCDALYDRQKRDEGQIFVRPLEKSQRKNFLSKNARYLTEIFKAMQLTEYTSYLKPKLNEENMGYQFSSKSKGFLVELLNQYTSENMLELRRGHWDKVSDRFIVWIVEGLYWTFKYLDVPQNVLEKIAVEMSNLTDYPVRARYGKVFQMTYDLEQLAGRAFWPRWKSHLLGNDNCIWLDSMIEDLKLFIDKWSYIYADMGEQRQEEVNEIAEINYYKRNPEYDIRAEMEFAFAEDINKAMAEDEKLKNLQKEMDKEIVHKKTGHYVDKQDGFEYMKKRIAKRMDEIEEAVYKEKCGDIDIPLEQDVCSDDDFDNMKSAEYTLKEALDRKSVV